VGLRLKGFESIRNRLPVESKHHEKKRQLAAEVMQGTLWPTPAGDARIS